MTRDGNGDSPSTAKDRPVRTTGRIDDGGAGSDTVLGRAGDDLLNGLDGADSLSGEAGGDTISGGGGNDVIWGDDLAPGLTVVSGDDSIDGGAGDDTLYAQGGSDVLDGGGGADWLEGGQGADTFIWRAGGGIDTISDYETGDTIRLLDGAGASVAEASVSLVTSGSDVDVVIDGTTVLVLVGQVSTVIGDYGFDFS